MEDRTQRYWMAPTLVGPYEVPPDGGVLAPLGHYAGRVCTWQGRHLYMCWHRPGAQEGPVEVDWTTMSNQTGKFVVAPLVLAQRQDGSLACQGFSGWDGYRKLPLTPPVPAAPSLDRGTPVWTLATGPGRMDLRYTEADYGDVYAQGTLRLHAVSGGLAFRLDPATSGGYFIELQAGSPDVLLKKWLLNTAQRTGQPWFRMELLQRGTLSSPLPADAAVPFKLILSGPYLELELAGQVVIATLSAERRSGRLGLWAESGRISLDDFQASPLRPLSHS
jgi:hypothetical protein